MLCCLLASLNCLQNGTFNCSKHGFLNSQNSNMSSFVFLVSFEWKMVSKWFLCQNDSWFLYNTLTAKLQFGTLTTSASFTHVGSQLFYHLTVQVYNGWYQFQGKKPHSQSWRTPWSDKHDDIPPCPKPPGTQQTIKQPPLKVKFCKKNHDLAQSHKTLQLCHSSFRSSPYCNLSWI